MSKKAIIIGCGFAGLNAAKFLGNRANIEVTVIDRNNYHLFQPLLYQVATAGLSSSDIAVPIRSILSGYENINVIQNEVIGIDLDNREISTQNGKMKYDYLVLCGGASTAYFGHDEWEKHVISLKTIEQALEIRRKLLIAFEKAEISTDANEKSRLLTFIIIGGGSTGVELSGAIGELSRHTLAKDYRNINPAQARIILVESQERILPEFPKRLSSVAARTLKALGVHVLTNRAVTHVDEDGVMIDNERFDASTILWTAGIHAFDINNQIGSRLDGMGRIYVEADLSVKSHPEVFVGGDQACFRNPDGSVLPAVAPVALQEGRFIAKTIIDDLTGEKRKSFHYFDKGQLSTIGKRKAVLSVGAVQMSGTLAWLAWLFIHIYYLVSFKNKLFVLLKWIYSYFTYRKGSRLIINGLH